MSNVLVLCSGGPDSLQAAREVGHKLGCLLFLDWGQPARGYELRAAQRCAELLGAPLYVRALASALFKPTTPPGGEGPRVVAGRNLLFVSVAVDSALEHGCDTVALGATLDDFGNYPDCRPDFVDAVSAVTRAAYGVAVMAPLLRWNKAQVMRALGSWADSTWSCYEARQGAPCGTCDACVARQVAGEGVV